jgi:glycerol uptake facilitator-like aquaporin
MNKYLVEFLGTLLLTFVIFATSNPLAIGISLAIALQLGQNISVGAFNPAATIALMYSGKLSQEDLVPYIAAQIAGALVGFELFRIGMNI